MILNLHGLYGGSNNSAFKMLSSIETADSEARCILSPEIKYQTMEPFQTILEIDRMIRDKDIEYVVGNSLGGFYALCIADLRKVPCIVTNPCVPPDMYIPYLVKNYPLFWKFNLAALSNSIRQFTYPVNVILGLKDEIINTDETYSWLGERMSEDSGQVKLFTIPNGTHHLSEHEEYNEIFERVVKSVENFIRS